VPGASISFSLGNLAAQPLCKLGRRMVTVCCRDRQPQYSLIRHASIRIEEEPGAPNDQGTNEVSWIRAGAGPLTTAGYTAIGDGVGRDVGEFVFDGV